MACRASSDLFFLVYGEVGDSDLALCRSSTHYRGDNFYPTFKSLLTVAIAAIQRISQELVGRDLAFLGSIKVGYDGIGIALVGRLHLDIGDKVQLFSAGIGVFAVCFGYLGLISLALVTTVTGIGIGGVLE